MSLIACCNGQQVLRSTCGSTRKRQSKCRETCGTPANAKANAGRLAGVPANVKANAGRLAEVPANAKANAGGPAGHPANAQKFFEALATVLQVFPKTFWSGFRRNSLRALFLHQTHVKQGPFHGSTGRFQPGRPACCNQKWIYICALNPRIIITITDRSNEKNIPTLQPKEKE